ncbi:MAG: RDD family protein [Thermoflavifilum sp.]|nr:RDD family protein [Thermoflavifilum sp.]MCL6512990.1 RDD family protein [Alicyclobacillus sp.]
MFCPQCGAANPDTAQYCQSCGTALDTAAGLATAGLHDAPIGDVRVRYGGFWIRFAAYFIDGILLGVVSWILVLLLGKTAADLVGVVLGWLYFAGMESSSKQATLGKMACGLRVTTEEGRRISFGRATGRYFAKIISSLILCIGYMMAGWTKRKQALHDMIASTLVIRAR